MVVDQADKIAYKMTELRFHYVQSCMRILSKVQALEYEFLYYDKGFTPAVSLGIKNIVDRKMQGMREMFVDNISIELSKIFIPTNNFNNNGPRKAKRFSKKIIEILESSFKKEKYPSDAEKTRLANICLISTKQVNNWFTNKRNRSKVYKNGYVMYGKQH